MSCLAARCVCVFMIHRLYDIHLKFLHIKASFHQHVRYNTIGSSDTSVELFLSAGFRYFTNVLSSSKIYSMQRGFSLDFKKTIQ